MGLLDPIKNVFKPKTKHLDVSARFALERQPFTGTMSTFRVAKEINTNRTVGIKFLDKEKTAHFNARFKGLNKPSEGEIGMKIRHPRVVTTMEYGMTTQGQEYILMEYIPGPGLNMLVQNVSDELKKNRLRLIRQMAEAIQAVHEAGFIHRDICPRNFICNEAITDLKLIDFGLTVPLKPEFCQPGNRTGTPQYMAPEVVRRRPTDQRLDIFSFGVTVYRMLTFEHPWGSTETSGLAALAHDTREPTPITQFRPKLDRRLVDAVHRCMATDVEKRTESMKRFIAQIRELKSEE
jgi:eukaryotic-like serine/threonine-protein kinase